MALVKSISGIRGTIGGRVAEGLSPVDVVRFVAAYATQRKAMMPDNKKIVVGRDARLSGAVNEMKIPRDPLLDIPAFKIAVFRFFTVIFTIMEAFMMKSVVLSVAGMFFSYDFEGNDSGNLFTLLLAIVIGLMLSSCGRTLHGLGKREKEDLKGYKKRLKNEVRK